MRRRSGGRSRTEPGSAPVAPRAADGPPSRERRRRSVQEAFCVAEHRRPVSAAEHRALLAAAARRSTPVPSTAGGHAEAPAAAARCRDDVVGPTLALVSRTVARGSIDGDLGLRAVARTGRRRGSTQNSWSQVVPGWKCVAMSDGSSSRLAIAFSRRRTAPVSGSVKRATGRSWRRHPAGRRSPGSRRAVRGGIRSPRGHGEVGAAAPRRCPRSASADEVTAVAPADAVRPVPRGRGPARPGRRRPTPRSSPRRSGSSRAHQQEAAGQRAVAPVVGSSTVSVQRASGDDHARATSREQ